MFLSPPPLLFISCFQVALFFFVNFLVMTLFAHSSLLRPHQFSRIHSSNTTRILSLPRSLCTPIHTTRASPLHRTFSTIPTIKNMASTHTDSAPVGNPQAAGIIYVQGVPTPETRLTLGGAISVSPMAIGTWAWGVSERKFSADKRSESAGDCPYEMKLKRDPFCVHCRTRSGDTSQRCLMTLLRLGIRCSPKARESTFSTQPRSTARVNRKTSLVDCSRRTNRRESPFLLSPPSSYLTLGNGGSEMSSWH